MYYTKLGFSSLLPENKEVEILQHNVKTGKVFVKIKNSFSFYCGNFKDLKTK